MANEPLHIRSADHPEADGRAPLAGDQGWTLDLEIEGGRRLFLHLGRDARINIGNCLTQEDDERDTTSAAYVEKIARVAKAFLESFNEFWPEHPYAVGEHLQALQDAVDGDLPS